MQGNSHIYRKEGEVTEREAVLNHLKQSQVCLAALTIVGKANTITEGRTQLYEFLLTLSDPEIGHFITAMTEMLALRMMSEAASQEEFHIALEKAGTLLSLSIADIEAQTE